jgi:hypothetical protein
MFRMYASYQLGFVIMFTICMRAWLMSSLDQERLARKQRARHKYNGEALYYNSKAAESGRPCAVGAAVGCILDDRLADDPHPDGVHGEMCSHKVPYDAIRNFVVVRVGVSSLKCLDCTCIHTGQPDDGP